VVINKPQKPDYSAPKAYRSIALMECVGKLLEKIVAKRINNDIERFNLLPMTQFGSRPHHSTIDAVATLVHKIQRTRATGHVGALLLFDISGFFDNINLGRAIQILRNKGFPANVCA
jgi:retron-type reverse transcriptase